MMKKQTAVEFAFEELNKWRIENFGEDALIGIPQEVLDKAKQMEREQIEDAFWAGDYNSVDFYDPRTPHLEAYKNYYNETYSK
jgi:hypothetical protein